MLSTTSENASAFIEDGIVQMHSLWEEVLKRENEAEKEMQRVGLSTEKKEQQHDAFLWNTASINDGMPDRRSNIFPFLTHPLPNAAAAHHVDPMDEGSVEETSTSTMRRRKLHHLSSNTAEEKEEKEINLEDLRETKKRRLTGDASSPSASDPHNSMNDDTTTTSSCRASSSSLPCWLSRGATLQRVPHLSREFCVEVEGISEKNSGKGQRKLHLLNSVVRKMRRLSNIRDVDDVDGNGGTVDSHPHPHSPADGAMGERKEKEETPQPIYIQKGKEHVEDLEEEKKRKTRKGEEEGSSSTASSTSCSKVEESVVIPERLQIRVICVDIFRSLWNLYKEEEERDVMRGCLAYTLLRVLYIAPDHVYYTQGLHELVGCVMFLFCSFREKVLGVESTAVAQAEMAARLELVAAVCAALLQTYWAPYACETLDEVQSIAHAFSGLLLQENPSLFHALDEISLLDHPHFLLGWLLTWFNVSIADIPTQMYITMLFLKGEDALTPLYFSTALVLHGEACLRGSMHEFKQQSEKEHMSSWKDYSYGLMFQRLSVLPSTLLEPPHPISHHHPRHRRTSSPTSSSSTSSGIIAPSPPSTATEVASQKEDGEEIKNGENEKGGGHTRGIARLMKRRRMEAVMGGEEENDGDRHSEGQPPPQEQKRGTASPSLVLFELANTTKVLRERNALVRVDSHVQNTNPDETFGVTHCGVRNKPSNMRREDDGRRNFFSPFFCLIRCLWKYSGAMVFTDLLGMSNLLSHSPVLSWRRLKTSSKKCPIMGVRYVVVRRTAERQRSGGGPSPSKGLTFLPPLCYAGPLKRSVKKFFHAGSFAVGGVAASTTISLVVVVVLGLILRCLLRPSQK